MTRILVSALDAVIMPQLVEKLSTDQNEIKTAGLDRTLELYKEFMPDILLMDFTIEERSKEVLERVVDFDNQTCVFGIAKDPNRELTGEMYKLGIRVILPYPKQDKLDEFVKQLYSSCSDLDHENCIGCWKTNRFEDLQKIS